MPIDSEPKIKSPENETETRSRLDALHLSIQEQKRQLDNLQDARKREIESNPKLKKRLEKLKKKREKIEEEKGEKEHEEEEEREHLEREVQVEIGGLDPHLFVEITPEREFFNPKLMKYITGAQYIALMHADRLSEDQKKKATKARFQFCYDMLDSEEYKEFDRKRKAYKKAFGEWREKLRSNPYELPPQEVQEGEPGFPIKTRLGKQVHQKFRNGIRTINEIATINTFLPDLFEHWEFVASIRMSMVGEIRKHDTFGEVRGNRIRDLKIQDYMDVLETVEEEGIRGDGSVRNSIKYFNTFTPSQLHYMRKRLLGAMDGKEREEVAGIGSRGWKSPLTMDMMNQTHLRGFIKSDEGDKKIIVRHLLAGLAADKLSSDNVDALLWLRKFKTGQGFFVLDDDTVRRLTEEMGIDYEKVRSQFERGGKYAYETK